MRPARPLRRSGVVSARWLHLTAGAAIVLAGLGAGCESTPTADRDRGMSRTALGHVDRNRAESPADDIGRHLTGRPTYTTMVQARIRLDGSVPYDSMSLPLVSPDGRYIATQSGVSPDWATLVAREDAIVPTATRIEVYRLTEDTDRSIEFVATVASGVVLSRSYDEHGFLVEAPQEDGSRRIGHIEWSTGHIEWLVDDEYINAFPSLGPEGQLAWSRRPVDGPDDQFDLVIRHHGHEWSIPASAESWLMPVWAGRGDYLFTLTLNDGYLEAVYALASDPASFEPSRRYLSLAAECTVVTAYQTLGAQTRGTNVHPAMVDRFIFVHPAQFRMAIWRPRERRGSELVLLDDRSFAATLIEDNFAMISTEDHLVRVQIDDRRNRQNMIAGTYIARPVNHEQWPYVLLQPGDDRIGIRRLRTVRPGE